MQGQLSSIQAYENQWNGSFANHAQHAEAAARVKGFSIPLISTAFLIATYEHSIVRGKFTVTRPLAVLISLSLVIASTGFFCLVFIIKVNITQRP
jgi:hypothetical protein